MIHVYIRGGRLGNQLFQYAFVRYLQKYNPDQKVCYHFDEVYNAGRAENGYVNSLKNFNVKDVNENNVKPNLTIIQRLLLNIYWRLYPHNKNEYKRNHFQRKWLPIMDFFNLKYLDIGYYRFRHKVKGDVIVSGCFESERYFIDIKDELLLELLPIQPISDKNISLLELMRNTNSVMMSIRRGDFVEDPKFSHMHDVCSKKYYERAWEYIRGRIDNPVLFIFSNDIEWAKKNLNFGVKTYFESGNDPSWEILELMSNCKYYIISNSTFNWWAQYKCTYKNKIVCAPSRWWNSPLKSELYMKNWVLIDVD